MRRELLLEVRLTSELKSSLKADCGCKTNWFRRDRGSPIHDGKHKSAALVFGALACAALFYEQGYKLDANKKSILSFIGFYVCPMLVVVYFVCRRFLTI